MPATCSIRKDGFNRHGHCRQLRTQGLTSVRHLQGAGQHLALTKPGTGWDTVKLLNASALVHTCTAQTATSVTFTASVQRHRCSPMRHAL